MHGGLSDGCHMGWHLWAQTHDSLRDGYHGRRSVDPKVPPVHLSDYLSAGTILQASSFSVGQMIAGRVITVSIFPFSSFDSMEPKVLKKGP
jgi:hypothetical protein